MTQALFLVDSPHEAVLPPAEELAYTDAVTGRVQGGWWVAAGDAPTPNTVLMTVDAQDAALDDIAALPGALYLGDMPAEVI